MKRERPILFAGAMVRAILALLKRMTRRAVTRLVGFGEITEFDTSDTPGYAWTFRDKAGRLHDINHERLLECCPYGQPGDRLWVRETWAYEIHALAASNEELSGPWVYAADGQRALRRRLCERWHPSIHMFRAASRITLEITGVRVERLHDISEADAIAEGVERVDSVGGMKLRDGFAWWRAYGEEEHQSCITAAASFRCLWTQINGRESWQANPWVWVVEFKRIGA